MISNPNLVSQIAKLPHLSDEQLKSYISDKSNPLSPFALATLQSKAIARKKFGTPEVPKQTVADQVEAEADAPLGIAGLQGQQPAPQAGPAPIPMQQPQAPAPQGMAGGGMVAFDEGGVASLPLRDDMYNEDSFAHGGIVGFSGKTGSYVLGDDYDPTAMATSYNEKIQKEYARDKLNRPEFGLGQIGAWMKHTAALGDLMTPGNVPTPYDAGINYYESTGDKNAKKILMGKRVDWLSNPTNLMENAGTPSVAKPPAATQDPIAPIVVPPAVPASIEKTTVANPLNDLLAARSSLGNSGSPYVVKEATVDNFVIPSDFSNAEYKANRIQALADAGVDPEFYSKQAAKNEEDRQKLKGERTDAGWSAALRAGLGMMGGKSQNPWANISEGATAGLAQYGTDIKDIKSDEKLLRAADDKLAEAQYLQSRGDAEGAMKAKAERDALIIQAKNLNTQAANAAHVGFANAQNEQGKTVYTTQSAERIAQLSKDTQVAIANADINSREKIANLENTRAISTAQAKAYSDVVDEVTKQFTAIHGKDAQSTLPEGSDPQIVYNQMLRKALVARGLAPLSSNDAQYQVVASRPDTKK
jgi:hypothetical protein